MEAAGLKAGLSYSAGTYVCNDTFYRVCSYVRTHSLDIPCGFIHVPAPKGAEKGSEMTVENFTRGLMICAERLGISEVINAGKPEVIEQCMLKFPVLTIKRYMAPEWMEDE